MTRYETTTTLDTLKTAEGKRETAETARVSSEKSREKTEVEREQAETSRQEGEGKREQKERDRALLDSARKRDTRPLRQQWARQRPSSR